MNYKERVIFGMIMLVGLSVSASAFAQCSVTNWSPDADGADDNLNAPSAAGTPAGTSRFSGSCGLEVSNASWVESHHSSDEVYIARFYVLPKGSGGTVDVFVAHDNDTVDGTNTELFKVSYDGSSFIFDVSGAAGSSQSTSTTAATGWNLIEIKYDATASGTADFQFWVNRDWDGAAYDGQSGVINLDLTGKVEAVQLGAPGGVDTYTSFTFDAFEAHRSTPVGALVNCDANDDTNVSIADVLSTLNEVNTTTLQVGQPDCNADGNVSIADVLATLGIVNSGG